MSSNENDGKTLKIMKPMKKKCTILVLRVLAFCASISATIVMAQNKQTKTFVVGNVGTTPIKATLTAKFQDTPAFVFFVVANGMVCFHNLVMIMVEIFGQEIDYKGYRLSIIAILDMLNVGLISGGANAAIYMAELGKNGNKHAKWNKICDKFGTYCDHGGGSIIASFIALLLMLLISILSIAKISKPKYITKNDHLVLP